MGAGTLVRSIGIVRARARIGLKNLAYNMRRLVQLETSRHGANVMAVRGGVRLEWRITGK